MEHVNQSLFLLINAAPGASGFMVNLAVFIAESLIWIVPAGLKIVWLRSANLARHALVAATVAGLFALLVNQVIGLYWYHPRPFEAGIGLTLIPHVMDSSFPSDHLTLIWAVAISLLLNKQFRLTGWVLFLLGVPVAWARIYLGVHFPLDILGAVLVAWGSAWIVKRKEHRLIPPLMSLILPLYRILFSGFIRRGWVRQ
ncbi:phosphatase PAP2 family protein [Sulfurirhabdus autotrophica]|uniref:Undecaprenyl-diphosphatase n=1 Tax=Sulfurirhabdus autotrophica TaxID=1706046 RepID=A0A4R3Y120_9PROT|nr:phosphatase PAP2 family protein [Sulfurirhabdus autotrophica]TCV85366.1 undecaprenyl-diphosphatase [Sulfurirhabdus autotrophica]